MQPELDTKSSGLPDCISSAITSTSLLPLTGDAMWPVRLVPTRAGPSLVLATQSCE